MRAAAAFSLLFLCNCFGFNIIPTGGDSSSGGGKDASTTTTYGDADSEAGVVGINCGPDPDTGVILCIGISACPGLTVDQDLYPGCGFRVHDGTGVLDLECACYGQICPIGIASTCDAATTLMQDQSQYMVCMQINEGRCTTN
jgi:hypothetical protein